jgi:hypothetical protein
MPLAASCREISFPIPLFAPVTNAIVSAIDYDNITHGRIINLSGGLARAKWFQQVAQSWG